VRTSAVSIALWLLVAAGLSPMPASAGGRSAAGYHGAAFYQFLLTRHPPPFWTGGTVWPPANVYVYGAEPEDIQSPPPPAPIPEPPKPVTRRIPDAYLAAAHDAQYAEALWVKTAGGWRRDGPSACSPTPQWERTPTGFRQALKSDCE